MRTWWKLIIAIALGFALDMTVLNWMAHAAGGVLFGAPAAAPGSDWILDTGSWADTGVWEDSNVWKDS